MVIVYNVLNGMLFVVLMIWVLDFDFCWYVVLMKNNVLYRCWWFGSFDFFVCYGFILWFKFYLEIEKRG